MKAPIIVELNVPSGRMVVANDLRDGFVVIGDYDINTEDGIRRTSKKYAETGMVFLYVGNTDPTLFRSKGRTFQFYVGRKVDGRNPVPGSRAVANILTDLWWYCAVDYDEYVRRYGKKPVGLVLNCEPGVYRFTHVYPLPSGDDGIYTYIQRNRPAESVVDYKAAFDSLNFTAGQVLYDEIANYPNLYGKSVTADSIFKAADHLMVVNGNGADVHPNGWASGNPDLSPDSPSLEIPEFDRRLPWYPLSDYSLLARGAGVGLKPFRFNESFTALAFNVLRCIAVYGADWEKEKFYKTITRRCVRGLAATYPDQIPENFKPLLRGCP